MNEISIGVIVWLLATAALAILLPAAALLVWHVKTKSKIIPALCGAGIFVLFALGLESVMAVMYQAGVLNIYLCEVFLLLFTVGIALFAIRLYKNMKLDAEEAE